MHLQRPKESSWACVVVVGGVLNGAWGQKVVKEIPHFKQKTSPRFAEVQRFEPFASPSPHPYDQGVLRLLPKLTREAWERSLARGIRV